MQNEFSRTELLIGKEAVNKLKASRVAVFGVGGVGGYAVEALARSGVGALDLVDNDKICLTNINRQIIALHSTIGRYKVDVIKERVLDINPSCTVNTYKTFFMPETESEFDFSQYDYVVDAIDTVTGKIELVLKAERENVPIISSMGTGNKLDASAFLVSDIYKTSVCPLARVMRYELKRRGIKKLKVVWSNEQPLTPLQDGKQLCKNGCVCPPGSAANCASRRDMPGSAAFVPSAAGLIIAGEVIKDLLKSK